MTNQTNTTSQAPADLATTQSGQGKVCRMDDLVGKDFKILAFRDLPLSHQLSIVQYMPLEEGADSETPDSLEVLLPAYLLQHGDDEWGVLNIAAERLRQSVMADEDRATGSETWEEYAAAYCASGDVPQYNSDDRWPVLLSADNYETLWDGWHRMHSYMRSGAADVPAIFDPEERHYELIGARKGIVANCIDHAAAGKTGTFSAKYDQYAERNGQTFTVLGAVDPSSYDAEDCGEMFHNGTDVQAWPEEVESALNGKAAESEVDADEIIVKLADGCTLRSGVDEPDSEGALTAGDYVRLCGPDGEEIHFWSKDEWQADPALVMGAIMIAAAGNRLQPSVAIENSHSPGM